MNDNKDIPVKPDDLTSEQVGDAIWTVMTIPARIAVAVWDAIFKSGPERRD